MLDRLLSTEKKFQATFNQAAVGIAHVSLQGQWIDVNDKLCQIVGYSREEMLGFEFKDLTHVDDKDEHAESTKKMLRGELHTYSIEKRYFRKDNECIWVHITVSLVRDKEGHPEYFIAVTEDVTERNKIKFEMEKVKKELETLLSERTREKAEAELEFSHFFSLSSDVMALVKNGGIPIKVNQAFVDLLGYSEEDLKSRSLHSFILPEDVPATVHLRSQIDENDGNFRGFENRYLCKNGDIKHIAWSVTHWKERDLFFAIGRDITDKKKLEQKISEEKLKLAAASKINSIGRMAANIAHEINNPLTVIYGQSCRLADMCDEKTLDITKIKQVATDIEKMTERITAIIKGLRLFGREASKDRKESKAVSELIQDTMDFCQNQFRLSQIHLDVEEVSKTVTVHCRSVQISQVLLILINNAVDAVQECPIKTIKVTTDKSKDEVFIRVINSGPCIDEGTQENLFAPFFTTKPVGKGTGLGLNISREIIEQHKGRLYFEPYKGQTCFVVALPMEPVSDQEITGSFDLRDVQL